MNIVEVTVRMKDSATTPLKAVEEKFKESGSASGKGFSSGFDREVGKGTLGALFGKSGGSVTSDAQRAGQNAAFGFSRGMMQKFSQTLGSGLLSGLFGTSGGGKLFGSAGNTVVSDAAKQGQQIGDGLGRGLAKGLSGVQQKLSGLIGGILGGGANNADVEKSGADDGKSYSRGFLATVSSAFSNFSLPGLGGGKGGKKSASAADLVGNADTSGITGGMMPGIMGLSGKTASILGIGGSLLGALPALTAALSAFGVAGAGAGVISMGAKSLIGTKNVKGKPATQGPLYDQAQSVKNALSNTMQDAASAMLGPLKAAFSDIPGMLKGIAPALKGVFAGAGTLIGPLLDGINDLAHMVLPGLGQAFRAVAPLVTPLLDGFGRLIQGLLPGLISMLRAAMPAVRALSDILGALGKDLGSMFSSFAPVISASAVIFKALMDVLSALFPIIGKLAATLATALAPVFASLMGAIKSLLPAITVIGQVFAQFAAAVVTDLAGVFTVLAQLVKDLAPSFSILAKALGQVFNVLENSGVFALFGDALENIAPLLAKLINALVTGLAPVFPVLIQAVSQLGTLLITLLSAGLTTILQALIPVVAWVARLITVTVDWLAKNHLLLPVLAAIAIAINPVGAAVVGLIAVVGLLATHWQQIWTDIKNWTDDAIRFIDGLFHALPAPLQDALKVLLDSWKIEWDIFVTVLKTAWAYITTVLKIAWDGIAALFKVLTDLLTGNWRGALNAIKDYGIQVWNAIRGFFQTTWNALASGLGAALRAMQNSFLNVWGSILGFVRGIPGAIMGALRSLGSDLGSVGSQAMTDLWNGFKAGVTNITNWITGFAKGIVGIFKKVWGWFSPSKVMYEGGKSLMQGLMGGLKDHASQAQGMAANVGNGMVKAVGSGVARWRSTVLQALSMEGLSPSLVGRVLYQMQTESGGNPNAINNWDSNAAAGDPSRGLLQTIGSTFAAYHWPGTSWDIYNPLANIAAAINYARHTYGPTLMRGGMGMGSGHGYAGGGPTSAGWAWVGERGRELVKLPGGATVMPAGSSAQMAAGGARQVLVQLMVSSGGQSDFDKFMTKWVKEKVRVLGGGDVQEAFGRH